MSPVFLFRPLRLALVASIVVLLACQRGGTPETSPSETASAQSLAQKLDKQLLAEARPEEVGMSAKRLAHIDSRLQGYVEAKQLAGMVALVARRGKVVYHKAIGYRDLDSRTPMERSDIFRIMSMTKALTSVATMMLYEEGKLMLDDPLSKYIPEYKNPKVLKKLVLTKRDTGFVAVPAKREPTVRHLLTHTAGIPYSHPLYKKARIPDFHSLENLTLAQTMPKLAALPLLHEPGEQFTYGLNTDMLGYLVERVSGMSLSAFFEKRIFGPLGMDDTHFYLPPDKHKRLATLYEQKEGADTVSKHSNRPFADYPIAGAQTYYSGGAGLSSTATDYARFLQMLLNGGNFNGTQLLSPTTIALMTTNQIGDLEVWERKNKFGLGFEITSEKARHLHPLSLGSYEWGGAYCTHFWVDPQHELIAVLMTQAWPTRHWSVGEQFKILVYQAITDK